jgi:hypothetical protein
VNRKKNQKKSEQYIFCWNTRGQQQHVPLPARAIPLKQAMISEYDLFPTGEL